MTPTNSSKSRLRKTLVAAGAAVFFFAPPIALLAGAQPKAVDNRALAPTPSLEKGFDALDMIAPWATDRLPGRGEAVRTKAWIDYHLLQEMPASGKVIKGKDGQLFLGEDFTTACTRRDVFDEELLASYARLAEIIERSGRRAVVTIGPNKSSVVPQSVPDAIPTGACARSAVVGQAEVLDSFAHPNWIGLRERLAESHRQGPAPYWRTDTHWNSNGSAVLARSLAEHLDPELASRTQTREGTRTRNGDLMKLIGLPSSETMPSTQLSWGGEVVPDPRFATWDPNADIFGKQHWTTTPATGLVPGKSLVIGDSFAYAALGNLRPMFADGTFLWTGHATEAELLSHIKASDTVVIEMVERSLRPQHAFASPQWQAKVAAALGVAPPT